MGSWGGGESAFRWNYGETPVKAEILNQRWYLDPQQRGSGSSDQGKRGQGQKWESARHFAEMLKRRYIVQRDSYTEANTLGLKFNMANPKRFFPVSIR